MFVYSARFCILGAATMPQTVAVSRQLPQQQHQRQVTTVVHVLGSRPYIAGVMPSWRSVHFDSDCLGVFPIEPACFGPSRPLCAGFKLHASQPSAGALEQLNVCTTAQAAFVWRLPPRTAREEEELVQTAAVCGLCLENWHVCSLARSVAAVWPHCAAFAL